MLAWTWLPRREAGKIVDSWMAQQATDLHLYVHYAKQIGFSKWRPTKQVWHCCIKCHGFGCQWSLPWWESIRRSLSWWQSASSCFSFEDVQCKYSLNIRREKTERLKCDLIVKNPITNTIFSNPEPEKSKHGEKEKRYSSSSVLVANLPSLTQLVLQLSYIFFSVYVSVYIYYTITYASLHSFFYQRTIFLCMCCGQYLYRLIEKKLVNGSWHMHSFL